jgi:hypothetical protein
VKSTLVVLLCVLLAQTAPAPIIELLDAPGDSEKVRKSIEEKPEVVALRKDYFAFQDKYFWPLLNNEMEAIFGRRLNSTKSITELPDLPTAYVLPSFQSTEFITTGIVDVSQPQRRHVDYYRVGDLGFVEFVFHQDGERVHAAVVYFRPDAQFVPLRSKKDLARRIAWEKKKWERIKSWIIQHLPTKNSSNQALERTADRREDLLSMTSTLKPEAVLAVVSGRSACSR